MKKNQSPIHTAGHRNVFCPYYSDCLDHAAKSHWAYWSCLKCQHKQEQDSVTDVLLSPEGDYPYYSLSPSLYEKAGNFSF